MALEILRKERAKEGELNTPLPPPPVLPLLVPCMMFSEESYEENFPPLRHVIDPITGIVSRHFVKHLLSM